MVELEALQAVLPEITATGATLVAISPQLQEHSQEVVRKHKLTFDVLMDPGNQIAAQYGIRYTMPEYVRPVYHVLRGDLPKVNGDDSWTLPITSRFVIDRTGIIRAVDADADQSIRAEPSTTVAFLKNLTIRS